VSRIAFVHAPRNVTLELCSFMRKYLPKPRCRVGLIGPVPEGEWEDWGARWVA